MTCHAAYAPSRLRLSVTASLDFDTSGKATPFYGSANPVVRSRRSVGKLPTLILSQDMRTDRAEFRQSLHEAGLMEKRARLIRKNRILRMDRKATCLHELRALVNETLAQGGR